MALHRPSKQAEQRSTSELLSVLAPLLPADVVNLASTIEGQQEVLEHLATMIASTRESIGNVLGNAVMWEVKDLEGIWNRVSKGKDLKDHDEAREAIREFVFQALKRDEFQSLNRPMMEDPVVVRVGGTRRTVRLRELVQRVADVADAKNQEETLDALRSNGRAANTCIAPPILNASQWEEMAEELYRELGRPPNRQLAPFVLPETLTDPSTDEHKLLRGVCTAKDQRLLYFALQYLSQDETLIDEVRPAGLTADQLRVRKGIAEGLHHLEHFTTVSWRGKRSYAELEADKKKMDQEIKDVTTDYRNAMTAKDAVLAQELLDLKRSKEKDLEKIETVIGQLDERGEALGHVLHGLYEADVDLDTLHTLEHLFVLGGPHHVAVEMDALTTKTDFKAIAAEIREYFANSKEGALKESAEYAELMKSVKKQKGVEGNAACLRIIDKAVRNKMEGESQPEGRIEQVIALNRKRLMESTESTEQREELAEHDLPDPVSEWEARREFDAERPVPESAVDGAITMGVGAVAANAALAPAAEVVLGSLLSLELSTYLATAGAPLLAALAGRGAGQLIGEYLSNDIEDPQTSEAVRNAAPVVGTGVGVFAGVTALQIPGIAALEWLAMAQGAITVALPFVGAAAGVALARGFASYLSKKWADRAQVSLAVAGAITVPAIAAVGTPTLGLLPSVGIPGIAVMAPAAITLLAVLAAVKGASWLTDSKLGPWLKAAGFSDKFISGLRKTLQVLAGGTTALISAAYTGGIDYIVAGIGVAGAAVYRYFFPSRSAYLEYEKNVLEEIGISESDTFEQGKFDVEEVKHKYFELRFMTEYEPPEKDDPQHPGCLKPTPALVKLMQKMHGALVLHAANELAENVSADMAASAGVHADMGKYQEVANAALESEYATFAADEGPASAEHISHRAYKEIVQLQKSKKTRDSVLGSMWGGVKDFFYEVYTGKKPKPKEKK